MADTYKNIVSTSMNDKVVELLAKMPEFAKDYFTDLKLKNRSPRTIQQYAFDMANFFEWVQSSAGFKDINIHSLTAHDVLDKLTIQDIYEYIGTYQTYSRKENNRKVTIDTSESYKLRRACSLRSFFTYYFKTHRIENSLADLIPVPTVKQKEIVALEKEDITRILNAISETKDMNTHQLGRHDKTHLRDIAIVKLLFGTGIRASELVGIDVEDVDFYEYYKNDENTRGQIIVTRKGGKEALIPFGEEVKNALLDYLEIRDRLFQKTRLGKDKGYEVKPEDEPALFVSLKHQRLTVSAVEKMMKYYKEKAGINKKVTPHTARRTFATNLYSESEDIYLTAAALGHSSIQTTAAHYAKQPDGFNEKIVSNTENLLK